MRKVRFPAPTRHTGRPACALESLERRLVLSAAAYAVGAPAPLQSTNTPPLQGANGELYVSTSSGLFRTVGDGGSGAAKVSSAPATAMFDWQGALYFQTTQNLTGVLSDTLMKLDAGASTPVELKAGGQNRVAGTQVFLPTADKLYLGATAGVYVTDGTPQGTTFLHTGKPLGTVGGKLFFQDTMAGYPYTPSLWVTDGTAAGTTMVKDNQVAYNGAELGGALYFAGSDGLYRTDGTSAGTVRVSTARANSSLFRVGDALYFVEAITGSQSLYKSDGTTDGTVRVASNLNLAGYDGNPYYPPTIATVGDTVYFLAYDATNTSQVYSTSGPGTTTQVTNFIRDGYPGVVPGLVQVNGRLFFPTFTSIGYGMGTSNGTPGDYQSLPVANSGDRPTLLTSVGGSLYFARTNLVYRYAVDPAALDADGTLVVNGTEPVEGAGAGPDSISLARSGADVLVSVNGNSYAFPASAVRRITVNGLGGNDTLDVSADVTTPADGPATSLTYNAGSGTESLTVRGGAGDDVMSVGPTGVTAGGPAGTWGVFVRDLESLSVDGGDGADRIGVTANPVATLDLTGGAGDDDVTVGGGLLESLTGQVTLAGGPGTNTLTFDDSANATTSVLVGPADPAGTNGDRYALAADGLVRTRAGNKGTQTFAFSDFTGGVALRAGTAANVVTVTPDAATPFTIDGGNPQAPSPSNAGDAIAINLDGAGSPSHTATGPGAGAYSFADRAAIHYTGIEVPDDLSAPAPPTATFLYYAAPHKLVFRFAEPVLPGPLGSGIVLKNLTTGQTVAAAALPLSFAPLSNTATFTFTGASQGVLPPGRYRATLPAGSVRDVAGTPSTADFVFEFVVRPGDANGDGRVDFADLLALAKNYNRVGVGYTGGDFNYDGRVNFADLLALARNYQGTSSGSGAPLPTLPLSPAAVAAISAASPGIGVDTTFGNGGKVITDLSDAGTSEDWVRDATRTPDGKLVTVGGTGSDLAVLRYNADGTRDATFGTNGLATYHLANNTLGVAVHALDDGRVIVAGWAQQYVGSVWVPTLVLMRYRTDGSLDPTFGTDGVTTVDNGYVGSMTVLSDGKILIGGHIGHDGWDGLAALWRFNADGSVDTGFGTNGRLTEDQKTYYQLMSAAAPLPDGRALVVSSAGVRRLNADGTFDSSFATISPGGMPTVQPDGKILVLSTLQQTANDGDVLVRRYLPDGQPDTTFGTAANGGGTRIDLGGIETQGGLVVQDDGKILVGIDYKDPKVRTNGDFALVRLLPDGMVDANFGVNGHLIDPFDNPDWGEELVQKLVMLSPGRLVVVGGTNVRAPGEAGDSNTTGNVALAAYLLDPPIDIRVGVPDSPVDEGASFDVSAAGTTYANGTVVKYEWDFAYDGVSFTPDALGQTAQFTAGDDPSVVVALRVTTSDGIQAIAVGTVAIRNRAPVVDAGPGALSIPNLSVTLHPTADDVVPEALSFTIDWGDGTAPTTTTAPVTSTTHASASVSHAYAARGVYTVTVTATDGDGGTSTDTTTVRVGDILASVYLDTNGNGTQTTDEPARAGHRVFLDLNLNGVFDAGEPAGLTNADGQYLFDGLAPDVYSVRAVPLDGYQFSAPAAGAVNASVWSGGGAVAPFGLTQRGTIAGSVFNDADGNGRWDWGEVSVAFRSVTITPVNGTPGSAFNVSTDTFGNYRATGLAPGTYVVRANPPSGWVQTTPGAATGRVVSVGVSTIAGGVDFGQVQTSPGSVTGTVFEDADGDGVRGTTEKAASGRQVFVDANNNGSLDPEELVATTNSSGSYTLSGLPAGTYTIRLVPRGGWVQTAPAGGQEVTVTAGQQTVAAQAFGTQKVDFAPPQVTASTFDPATGRVQLWFGEPVTGLTSSDLRVASLSPAKSYTYTLVSYDAATGLATFDPPQGTAFAPATYRVTVFAGSVSDLAGNPLAADYVSDFTVPAPAPAATLDSQAMTTAGVVPAPSSAVAKKAPKASIFSVVPVAKPSPPRTVAPARAPARRAAR